MKKVKVMLSAVLVFAVVGGALAFKAKNYNESLKCGNSLSSCAAEETDLYKTTTGTHYESTFCTTIGGTTTNCTFVTIE